MASLEANSFAPFEMKCNAGVCSAIYGEFFKFTHGHIRGQARAGPGAA
jgi:hypothetical protein